MPRYDDVSRAITDTDEAALSAFVRVYTGAPLAERFADWLKLHQDGQPLEGNYPYEEIEGAVIEPYLNEIGDDKIDALVLLEIFDLEFKEQNGRVLTDNGDLWNRLFAAYQKIPVADQVSIFKAALEQEPNGWVLERLYNHLKTKVTGVIVAFIPLLDELISSGVEIDHNIKIALIALADQLLEKK